MTTLAARPTALMSCVIEPAGPPLQRPSSHPTLRWRGTDSNFRFRDALAPPTAPR